MTDTFWDTARERANGWHVAEGWKSRHGEAARAAADSLEDAIVLLTEAMIAGAAKLRRMLRSDRPVRELFLYLHETLAELARLIDADATPRVVLTEWRRRKTELATRAIEALGAL